MKYGVFSLPSIAFAKMRNQLLLLYKVLTTLRFPLNPFPDISGMGTCASLKKSKKYCFELSAMKLFLSMPRRLLNTW